MKKLLSMTLALALTVSGMVAVTAADKTPKVYVDKSEILFEDQEPVILGEGYTVIPARGVFESMGATVEWDGETKKVEVTSADNKTLIRLFIDDSTMRVYDLSGMMSTLLSGQDFKAPETDVTLDVAPQIIGDRTMIPLRAISEALDADVQWDGAAYEIDITTKDASKAPASALPEYTLSADKLTAAEGETVDLYIDLKNMPEGKFVSSVSAAVSYDPTAFEFVEAALVNGDTTVDGAYGASNSEFIDGVLKVAYVTINSKVAANSDGRVMKLTFKSLNGKEGAFALTQNYHTNLGFSTTLLVDTPADAEVPAQAITYEGNDLVIDRTPVVINAAGAPAPEVTAEPTATPEVTPETTVEPTAEPEATPEVTPDAAAEPTAEPTPEATPAA